MSNLYTSRGKFNYTCLGDMGNHTVIIHSLESTLEPGGEDGEEGVSQRKERGDL